MEPLKLVLDPVVFDAMELAVLATGGIGAGAYEDTWEDSQDFDAYVPVPFCAVGFRWHLTNPNDVTETVELMTLPGAVDLFNTQWNDAAVRAVNKRKGLPPRERDRRITWKQYCKARRIVRGPTT